VLQEIEATLCQEKEQNILACKVKIW
jgi:hypothetical protein